MWCLIFCKRCGRCCQYIDPDTHRIKRCKHLLGTIGKETFCVVYASRLGREIAPGIFCFERVLVTEGEHHPLPVCELK